MMYVIYFIDEANHASRVDCQSSLEYAESRIRELRTTQGWTHEQLAEIAGITPSNLRNIEAGKYSVGLDVLNRIAGALGAELRMEEV